MIKIEKTQKCMSYLKNDTAWDLKRDRTYKIKIFGLTLYSWDDSHSMDLEESLNQVGFKKSK